MIKEYFVTNPGAIFIIAFQALILTCASLLIQGNPLVDGVAIFAYCSLVVGVVLQGASSVWQKTSEEGV